MKKESGKKGSTGYEYEEKTLEEMESERKANNQSGTMWLIGVLGVVIIGCATILIYKVLCIGGTC